MINLTLDVVKYLRKERGNLSFETIHRRVVYYVKVQEDIRVDR